MTEFGIYAILSVAMVKKVIAMIFVLALFAGSGASCVCSMWSTIAGGNQDCCEKKEAFLVCEEETHSESEAPSIPCNEANGELPDLQVLVESNSKKEVPALVAVLTSVLWLDAEYQLQAGVSIPPIDEHPSSGPPLNRRVVFCRYLI